MSTQISAYISVGAALLALPGIALAQDAAPSPLSASSPLATARTIQLHETLLRQGGDGTLPPPYSVAVSIERPNKVKLVISSAPGKRPDQYVSDGANEYQYDGRTNKYRVDPLPASGKSSAQVRGITVVNFFINGGHLPAPAKGSQRTVTADTLGGRAMTLTTDTESVKAADGTTTDIAAKVWVDAQSHLPYRIGVFITAKGVTKTYEDVTFSNWVFNKPIPPAQLAWTPPAGSKILSGDASNLLAVGTPAPDFSAITPDGKTVHLSDYKGKIVVLDFWATWCGPCQRSMPHLESVYKKVQGQNVAVLGLCVWDQKAAYDKWVAKKSGTYTFQTAFDPAGHGAGNIAGSLYNVSGIPTQYVIDKTGKVAAAYTGYSEGGTELEKALAAQGVILLAPTSAAAPTP